MRKWIQRNRPRGILKKGEERIGEPMRAADV
jgi:hypothetical protein